MYAPLLTRDAFREGVFKRDNHRCVFCHRVAVDAHHIIERRLFADGGYYLDNGASVCEEHHLLCEMTTISLDQVRQACGIRRVIVPSHLYPDQAYDKWGNPVLANGQRTRGELFFDESVQKILARGGALELFTNRVKFPRTHHLPWSEGMHDDDRRIDSLERFIGRRVIATIKMDGENTSLYSDYLHARSVDGRHHESRNWVKGFWASISQDIPPDWRICGENLFAVHSIAYQDLQSFFMGFGVWNERNVCLSWDDTKQWFELLGITPVEVIFDGLFDENAIRKLYDPKRDWATSEGFVLRVADAFSYGDYRTHVAKFVRKGHIQTTKHWMHGQRVVRNGLAA
ncbi:RNA ligase family protein [Paucibacter soli]|uniref:RNA ligase family protein n=1 Tax=Paucibacter soli TaxID=3133433 RepID=UPI0030A0C0B5